MNRKEKYESPWMERTLVELEDGFCAGSVDVRNSEAAKIDNQTINTEFSLDGNNDGFADGSWE